MTDLISCTGISLGIILVAGIFLRWDRAGVSRDRERRRAGLDVRSAMERR
jgi:hypothetical protein